MRALVTGGAGFIGSTLVDRLLAEGHAVDVVDDLSTGSLANLAEARADRDHELKVHQVDIRDGAVIELIARRQPEVVFHLAAQADVRVSVARPVFDAEVNVIGSLNVLEGARARRIPQGRVRVERRHDLRRAGPVGPAGAGVPPAAAALALRRGQAGRHRLPPRLPGAPRARVHVPGHGQHLRSPPGPPRRGRGGGDLRRAAAGGEAVHDLRRRRRRRATSCTSTTPSTRSCGPPTGGAVCSATSAPAWRRRSTTCTQAMADAAGVSEPADARSRPPGRAGPQRARPRSSEDAPRLGAVDRPPHRRRRRPGLLPRLTLPRLVGDAPPG